MNQGCGRTKYGPAFRAEDSPRLWDAERDSPGHPPTLMKEAHDSEPNFRAKFPELNFLDKRANREQYSLAAAAGFWMTRRSDHRPQCNRDFRLAPRLFSTSGFPFLIPNLFRVQAEVPKGNAP
jgi:hypothetical protein